MKQQTLTGFEKYRKTTRRAQFLADMDRIVPWTELRAVVEPFYPKLSEAGGRPPLPLERMIRRPRPRMYISDSLTDNERSRLHLQVKEHLRDGLPEHVVDAVLSELECATALAKPSADYEKAVLRNRTMDRSVRRWTRYVRQPDKIPRGRVIQWPLEF